jgi:SpoIID/LytB domain protein
MSQKYSGLLTIRNCMVVMLVFIIFLSLSAGCARKDRDEGTEVQELTQIFDVMIVKSSRSIEFSGWKGELDFQAVSDSLAELGVSYKVIEEEELDTEDIPCKILILPNARCLDRTSANGIINFVSRGGKLLATYMSGYRDQDNNMWGRTNNFVFSDIYGVDFYKWSEGKPGLAYMQTFDNRKIQLGRYTGMLVKPRAGTEVLATWLDIDGKPQRSGGLTLPAITYNKNTGTIYCGEDIFASENSGSGEVLQLIATLLEKLEPGIVHRKIEPGKHAELKLFDVPVDILEGIIPGGPPVTVGLSEAVYRDEVRITSKAPVSIGASKKLEIVNLKVDEKSPAGETGVIHTIPENTILKIRPVFVVGKEPYIAVYSVDNQLLVKAYGSLLVRPNEWKSALYMVENNPNGTYRVKLYRGGLEFLPHNQQIAVRNKLSMQEYVAGVLPSEMPATYPMEALKAMAVINRTFALSQVSQGKHSSDGYDICDTIHCQVYGGLLKEREETNSAVHMTSNLVLFHEYKPAFTTFHAVCGGFQADVTSVWSDNKISFLSGRFDGSADFNKDLSNEKEFREFIDNPPSCFCSNAGRFRWIETYSKSDMEKKLQESLPVLLGRGTVRDFNAGKLISMKITKRSHDGRARQMEIVTTNEVYKVEKDKMRWITSAGRISTGGLPSTLFYIEDAGNVIVFKGGGWGHGTGMCQEGARGIANIGCSFMDIINHYYSGVELIRIQ